MGWGDEIMVTGEVRRRAAGTARRFAVRDVRWRHREHRWHDIWEGNPHIARPGEPFDEWILNCPGNRPYIAAKGFRRWTWQPYRPEPGEIFLAATERALGGVCAGSVLVQVTLKAAASPNKDWGWDRWQALTRSERGVEWLQIGEPGTRRLDGVRFHATRTFREACAVLSGARAAVLHEGGLHHAAAALAVPAVVIFGGFVAPAVTGYERQRSLFTGGAEHPLGCGMRTSCRHCHRAMAAITPRDVVAELSALLLERDPRRPEEQSRTA
jgi:hypothetical protein